MNDNYLDILRDALEKKIEVLDKIMEQNKLQEEILSADEVDFDAFEKTVDEKAGCIEKLNKLDNGFQMTYDRIKEELTEHKDAHREEIKKLQELIQQITEKSMNIQAGEKRNKETFQQKISFSRKNMLSLKTANRVAANYYQNMNKLNVIDSQFLDTKK